ncbi:hypothetical protein D3C73_1016940 [compost metagenome]
MSGSLVPTAVEVIGHDVDPVDNGSNTAKVVVLNVGRACAGSNGQQVAFTVSGSGRIQLFTDFLQQQHVILLILRTVAVACQPPADRVFPVQIDTIHMIFADKIDCGICENFTGRSRSSNIRETV